MANSAYDCKIAALHFWLVSTDSFVLKTFKTLELWFLYNADSEIISKSKFGPCPDLKTGCVGLLEGQQTTDNSISAAEWVDVGSEQTGISHRV